MLWLKGNLCCLATRHIVYLKSCLVESLAGRVGMFLILEKGTWPSLLCHNRSTLSLASVKEACLNKVSVLLQVEVQIKEQN